MSTSQHRHYFYCWCKNCSGVTYCLSWKTFRRSRLKTHDVQKFSPLNILFLYFAPDLWDVLGNTMKCKKLRVKRKKVRGLSWQRERSDLSWVHGWRDQLLELGRKVRSFSIDCAIRVNGSFVRGALVEEELRTNLWGNSCVNFSKSSLNLASVEHLTHADLETNGDIICWEVLLHFCT
jgi:hypothetical protein